jgi:CheY-like chemotaxis protein
MAKILVVDDEEDLRDILVRIVGGAGHEVLAAHDGASAIAAARASQPSLVILDLMMPGTDGFDVLRTLRADPGGQDVPVVVYTALSDRKSRERAMALGATAYLVKNEVGVKELRAMVDQYATPETPPTR